MARTLWPMPLERTAPALVDRPPSPAMRGGATALLAATFVFMALFALAMRSFGSTRGGGVAIGLGGIAAFAALIVLAARLMRDDRS